MKIRITDLPEYQSKVLTDFVDKALDWIPRKNIVFWDGEDYIDLYKAYSEEFLSDIVNTYNDKEIDEIIDIINKGEDTSELKQMLGLENKYNIGDKTLKKHDDGIVKFKNPQELKDFMNFLHEMGYTWNSGNPTADYVNIIESQEKHKGITSEYIHRLGIELNYSNKKILFEDDERHYILGKTRRLQYDPIIKMVVDKFNSM